MFLSLKNHFTQEKYDFFKYNGKIRGVTKENFTMNSDRFLYQRICREYDEKNILDFFVANFAKGKVWVRDFLEEEAREDYLAHTKHIQSLSYQFANEIDKLFRDCEPTSCFKPKRGMYPDVFMYYLSGNLSIHSMVILNDMIGFISRWDKAYVGDSIWPKHSILIKKYAPFLEYDKSKLKNILKDKIKEYEHGKEQEESRTPSPKREEAA